MNHITFSPFSGENHFNWKTYDKQLEAVGQWSLANISSDECHQMEGPGKNLGFGGRHSSECWERTQERWRQGVCIPDATGMEGNYDVEKCVLFVPWYLMIFYFTPLALCCQILTCINPGCKTKTDNFRPPLRCSCAGEYEHGGNLHGETTHWQTIEGPDELITILINTTSTNCIMN